MNATESETKTLKTERTDLPMVDPFNLVIEEGFNERGEDNYGDMEWLTRNIVANGVIDAFIGFKIRGVEKYIITEGHRRYRAVQMAHQYHLEGKPGFEDLSKILRVPFRPASADKKERLYIMANTGNGKVPLKDLEKAKLYADLLQLEIDGGVKKGEATKNVIARLGISQSSFYGTLSLNDVDNDVKDFIRSGQISGGTVVQIVREVKDNEKVKDIVLEAIYNAEETKTKSGKPKKATAANVKGLAKKTPIARLKELASTFEKQGHSNSRTKLLESLIEGIENGDSIEQLTTLFQ